MNDLIRRDKAIDYFVTNIGIVDADGYAVDDYDERVKIWTERFSGIPSAESERKWIPVREALPNSDWVLGQIREKDSGYLWIPRQVEYRESRDDWYEESIGWFKGNPDHAFEVIAWMPLPEVYRGE